MDSDSRIKRLHLGWWKAIFRDISKYKCDEICLAYNQVLNLPHLSLYNELEQCAHMPWKKKK